MLSVFKVFKLQRKREVRRYQAKPVLRMINHTFSSVAKKALVMPTSKEHVLMFPSTMILVIGTRFLHHYPAFKDY